MRYSVLRHAPAASLISIFCLAGLILRAVVTPASAAVPTASTDKEKVSIEIVVTSDDEVTTTFLTTAPSDDEQTLKGFCVDKNFSNGSVKPEVTFSSENGTPTCKAVLNTSVSGNEYVTHDKDEYVIDTHKDSASEEDKNSSVTLSAVFPGKVTDAGGGKVEGEKQNRVSFDDFYDNRARGKDTAEAASGSQSGAVSDASVRTGFWILVILSVLTIVGGGVVALIGNANKRSREQRYLAALTPQSHRTPAGSTYQPFAYASPTLPVQSGPSQPQPYQPQYPHHGAYPPAQMPVTGSPGYMGAPPYQQPPGSFPPTSGEPYPPSGWSGQGGY